MNYYVVLGIAEDADEEDDPERLSSVGEQLPPGCLRWSSPGELQRAREPYEALADPERRCRHDQQLQEARVSSPRFSFGFARPGVLATRSSFFDEWVEELLASDDEGWLGPPQRW